jgi:hypothetical protein
MSASRSSSGGSGSGGGGGAWLLLQQLLPPWLSTEDAARCFEWGVCACYAFAFSSAYTQVGGILGPDGVLPLGVHWPRRRLPAPLRWLRWRPDLGADAVCLRGGAIAVGGMLSRRARHSCGFAALWWLYSCVQRLLGHDPPLLFEVGALAVILGRGSLSPPPPALARGGGSGGGAAEAAAAALRVESSVRHCGLVAARWLLFRLLFGAGAAKLLGGEPSWWDSTAVAHHYQSQALPTRLAWWMHQLPMGVHRLSTAAMFVAECGCSLLCFAPGGGGSAAILRRVGFAVQLGLQLLIGGVGSFSFFNVLTAVLALPLLAADHGERPPPLGRPLGGGGGGGGAVAWQQAVLGALGVGGAWLFRRGGAAAFGLAGLRRWVVLAVGGAIALGGRECACGVCLCLGGGASLLTPPPHSTAE